MFVPVEQGFDCFPSHPPGFNPTSYHALIRIAPRASPVSVKATLARPALVNLRAFYVEREDVSLSLSLSAEE